MKNKTSWEIKEDLRRVVDLLKKNTIYNMNNPVETFPREGFPPLGIIWSKKNKKDK